MSEYQYYEFQAIDRPLTAQEQAALRRFSSRATITPSRFAVDYSWGVFKGDANEWMEKYFDAFLYLANWGSQELKLRLPQSVLPLETARQYCAGDSAAVRAKGEHVIFTFRSDDEEGGEWIDEDDCTLASLLPVRAELASGDLRALYIAWLGCLQCDELEEEELEPPCPPGLRELSPALEELARFLRIDDELIEVAAAASPELGADDDAALEAWLRALPETEKTSYLLRVLGGGEGHLRAELLRRFRESRKDGRPSARGRRRSVGELLDAVEARREEQRRQQAERAAREKARREREAAAARERHLTELAKREAEAWREVDALIAARTPAKYDEAIVLLGDLRDVCARAGRQEEAAKRIARLREEHARKVAFIGRLRTML